MKRIIAAAAISLLAAPAFAFQCPADMAAIDAALADGSLSEADMAKVQELRAQGEELHASGDHQASVDALAEAKMLLGIE
mgnify:CR=1 FL=1